MLNLLQKTYQVIKSDKSISEDAVLYSNSLGLSESQFIKFFKSEDSSEVENLIEELDYQKNIMAISEGLDNAIKNEINSALYN